MIMTHFDILNAFRHLVPSFDLVNLHLNKTELALLLTFNLIFLM